MQRKMKKQDITGEALPEPVITVQFPVDMAQITIYGPCSACHQAFRETKPDTTKEYTIDDIKRPGCPVCSGSGMADRSLVMHDFLELVFAYWPAWYNSYMQSLTARTVEREMLSRLRGHV